MSATWSRSGDVYELCLDHAPGNEIGLVMLERLEQFVEEVASSSAKAVIVYSARPLGFSAGADLRGLYARMQEGRDDDLLPEIQRFLDRIHAMANRFDALPQTTFGAMHGVCFGGGFELALLCDVLIADRSSRFCVSRSCASASSPASADIPRLSREVPNAVVRDLLLTGRSIDAHARPRARLGIAARRPRPGAQHRTRRGAPARVCSMARSRGAAKAFLKPLKLDELEREKSMFMRMIIEPRVRAALSDFRVAHRCPALSAARLARRRRGERADHGSVAHVRVWGTPCATR